MVEYEEKFIVINKKHIEELDDICGGPWLQSADEVIALEEALKNFKKAYEENTDKKLDQKYYVVNQDEYYAGRVIQVILTSEMHKEKEDK